MKPGFLRSSTAMVLVASLAAAPIPSFAQSAGGDAAQSEESQAEMLRMKLQAAAEGDPRAMAEIEAELGAEGMAKVMELRQSMKDSADAAAESDATVEGSSDTAPETATSEPTPEADAAPLAAETEAEPAPEAAPEAAQAEPAAEPEQAAESPEAGNGGVAAQQDVTTDADTAPQADTEKAAGAAPEAEGDIQTTGESPEEANPEAVLKERLNELVQGLGGNAETDPAAPDADVAATKVEDVAPMDSEEQAKIQAEAEADAPAAMAATEAGAEAEAEVVEETVTDETARSSNEEFTTDLQGEVRTEVQAKKKKKDDDDKGLSDFEKAALLGIGAVAIGSLLRKNETVAANTGDRIVAERDGQYRVIKNDDALLRQPGSDIKTYNYSDGSTRTIVTREDGTEVETIRAADGRVLRRSRTLADGSTALLFDDTQQSTAVEVSTLPTVSTRRTVEFRDIGANELAETLTAAQAVNVNRTFSLSQIRNINAVRQLVPEINVDSVNFETNSAVIRPEEAEELAALGNAMKQMIDRNPSEVFLIEGHTDAVGAGSYNLALSDRRAESVALALTEYFDVPPENLVVQGYGESDLIVPTPDAERANRRAAVRRITPLLDGNNI